MKPGQRIERVDIQVTLITALLVTAAVVCVYLFNYTVSYQDMIEGLSERTESIYKYVDRSLDKSTFHEINSVEDQQKNSYVTMKEALGGVRAVTGVRYLYTAKRTEDGRLVYVVDGLPADSEDFRNAGDPIEEEIVPELERALSGEMILPDDIVDTTWGHVFVSYSPVHEDGQVVGAVGIEFDAERQYQTYRTMRIATPLIALTAILIACLIAVKTFRRISNPRYQDLANTDQLTGLKNRNAFDVDLQNFIHLGRQNGMAVFSIDLDGLKRVNDALGHQTGDQYIRDAAEILRRSVDEKGILYRVGGDEFVILGEQYSTQQIEDILRRIRENTAEINRELEVKISMAGGFAVFDPKQDRDISETYQRADLCMYQQKRQQQGRREEMGSREGTTGKEEETRA